MADRSAKEPGTQSNMGNPGLMVALAADGCPRAQVLRPWRPTNGGEACVQAEPPPWRGFGARRALAATEQAVVSQLAKVAEQAVPRVRYQPWA